MCLAGIGQNVQQNINLNRRENIQVPLMAFVNPLRDPMWIVKYRVIVVVNRLNRLDACDPGDPYRHDHPEVGRGIHRPTVARSIHVGVFASAIGGPNHTRPTAHPEIRQDLTEIVHVTFRTQAPEVEDVDGTDLVLLIDVDTITVAIRADQVLVLVAGDRLTQVLGDLLTIQGLPPREHQLRCAGDALQPIAVHRRDIRLSVESQTNPNRRRPMSVTP